MKLKKRIRPNKISSHQFLLGKSLITEPNRTESIDLVITSPPYPMIAMWDDYFSSVNSDIRKALDGNNGKLAFHLMHSILDEYWKETVNMMKYGSLACINIGDATRTLGDNFRLYPNHARVITAFENLDCESLPPIIWNKPTNAPNKFMGSGMLPPNAYITLEHEHILIFRKGWKRTFNKPKAITRRESAFFWAERNEWFTNIWRFLLGENQSIKIKNKERRSAAFPFAIPYRLINMFSVKGDTVLDPFLGTGTTALAAMASNRNSISYEIDESLKEIIEERINGIQLAANEMIDSRIEEQGIFVDRNKIDKKMKYKNKKYKFNTITKQEEDIILDKIRTIRRLPERNSNTINLKVHYE